MKPEIVVRPNPNELIRIAARRFGQLAHRAVASRGRCSVALSGGSTPGPLYQLLTEEPYRTQIPWAQVHLFWGDERCVPPDDPDSNYRMAHETLIARVPIPPGNVHRMRGELAPEAAARAYEHELQEFFCGPRTRFDLVLLGLGTDGHTASLFPGSMALDERGRLAVAVTAQYEDRPAHRVTLTLSAINTARYVWFLVSGSAKAESVRTVLEGPTKGLPAQLVQPMTGQLTWFLDAEAASQLKQRGATLD
ncbi:MAG: 6-phosphogluconolactonase [Anaerolineae bacterium]|jgi:6-phosphogluconolactonase